MPRSEIKVPMFQFLSPNLFSDIQKRMSKLAQLMSQIALDPYAQFILCRLLKIAIVPHSENGTPHHDANI